jgi:hypothetical protein
MYFNAKNLKALLDGIQSFLINPSWGVQAAKCSIMTIFNKRFDLIVKHPVLFSKRVHIKISTD